MKKSFFNNSYFMYTVLFLLLLPIVFLSFLKEGKSFVWYLDGLDQHLPLLRHYGEILKELLTGKGFAMVDFQLGLGFDTITTMNYYVLGDPLTLFSVFINPKNAVRIYDFLILLRFYLAGISFLIFMGYWKKKGLAAALGALIYTFCGYSMFAGIRHPYFMNPLIYLPLLLIGAEQVLRRQKPYLLIAMVFVSAVSNFYFFFVLSVILVIYIVFRYATIFWRSEKHILTGFLHTGLRTGGCYLLGILLAAFILLPVVYAFTQNGRLDQGPKLITGLLHYNKGYYLSFLQGILAPGVSVGYWTNLSFSSVMIISFAVVFANRKYLKLQVVYVLAALGLSIPAFGMLMNGFSYISNRWCFLVSLLAALTFTLTYDKFFDLESREKRLLLTGVAGYGLLAFLFPSQGAVKQVFFILLLITGVILLLQSKGLKKRKLLQGAVITVLVTATLAYNGNYNYLPGFKNYVSQFLSEEKIENLTSQGVLSLISKIRDDSFYRIDTYGDKVLNEGLTVGYNQVSGYFSLMDGTVNSYLKELEVCDQVLAYRFEGLDNRTILDALSSVKYFVTTKKSAVPYGYKLIKKEKDGRQTYYIFQNQYALPLGYRYNNYMTEEEYDKLSALQKQNVMLSAIILDDASEAAGRFTKAVDKGIQKLEVKLLPDENVLYEGKSITVTEAGAKLTLEFSSAPKSETYVRFGNLTIDKKAICSNFISVKGKNGAEKWVNAKSIYYNTYFGKVDYLLDIGYSSKGETQVTITFPEKMKYHCDSIEVYSLNMKPYKAAVKALSHNTLTNIKQDKNHIQGEITLDNKGILALTIPYSKGWSAYVDGKKSCLLRGNIMYLALPLEAGSHHIELKYETPYLRAGTIISFITLLGIIGTGIITRARDRVKS